MNTNTHKTIGQIAIARFALLTLTSTLLLLVLPAVVQAQFNYTTNNGTVTIAEYTGLGGDVTIPDTIDGLPVTSIGDSAFYYKPSLTSVTIPNSVTSIGEGAFFYCTGLTNVIIPNNVTNIGVYAFTLCTGLKAITVDALNPSYSSPGGVLFNKSQTVLLQFPGGKAGSYTIPNSVTGIGDSAFYYCQGLTNVIIGNGVTSIGHSAFNSCSGLTSVIIGNNVTTLGEEAFYSCSGLTSVTIGNSVTTIGDWAFYSCPGLISVIIPDSVTRIGDSAFNLCSGLTSVIIGNSVTTIGYGAFYYCAGLTNVSIPNSVTNIGYSAFAYSGLTAITVDALNPSYSSVEGVLYNKSQTMLVQYPGGKAGSYAIPGNVTSIGNEAFYGCQKLTSVTIPGSVTNIDDGAFYYCVNLQSVTIPNSVTRLGDEAFYGCFGLTSVTIPDSVARIGAGAFFNCSSLSSVAIPNSVTTIEAGVFGYCGLTSITIPGSVTNIGEGAFQGCGLSGAVIPGSVARIETYAFAGCANLTSLTLSNGVANIQARAFFECYSLTNLWIPQSVTNIGPAAFAGCGSLTAIEVDALNPFYRSVDGVLFDHTETLLVQFPNGKTNSAYTVAGSVTTIGVSAFEYATGLSSITIGNGVRDIQDSAFYNCYNLTSVAIGNGVTNIGQGAFGGCSGLTSIAIPDSVTIIGDEAFIYCSSLRSIAIPDSVTIIGDQAFAYCYNLSGVVFNGDAPALGGTNVFWIPYGQLDSIVYYLPGTTGWGPTFGGLPTTPWLLPHPLITLQPVSTAIERGATISFAVRAIGRSILSYQWRHHSVALSDGGNISGANTGDLTIWNAELSDSGAYTVTVGDATGSIVSQPAQLTVSCVLTNEDEAFVIRSVARETNGSFTLAWDSSGCYLYEVQTSEESLVSTNWTSRAFMIGEEDSTRWPDPGPPVSDHQWYRVKRYSPGGDEDGDGLSNIFEHNRGTDLHNSDTDGDQMPDGWEAQYDLNPLDPEDRHADLDGDGYSNGQEYQLHTRPNASYSQPAYLPSGLVAWWKLDEGTGTNVFDSSLNGHDGFVMGGDPVGAWTEGAFSNAAALGGPANNWIQVPYRASLAATQELTLMGWVKPSGGGVLIANWPSAGAVSGNYLLAFGPDAIAFNFSPAGYGGYQNQILFNPNWSTNDWHHLAVTYANGTNVAVFVDGELRASRVTTETFLTVENPIMIGFPGSTDATSVDDVRIYNRALGTNEIASFSRGNGLPESMIVGQTATLRAFGASEGDTCQWSVVSGQGIVTNTANLTAEFRPSWSGSVTVQVVYENSGVLHTNLSHTTVTFPSLSPLSEWNDNGNVQYNNNCYNFSADIRTDTMAQPGGPPFYYLYTCELQTSAAISDGLQSGVDLADLCHSSGLPDGHIAALLILPPMFDFHWVRMEADGTWSSKAGSNPATTLDNAGQPITDPRTANWQTIFGSYQFCGFFWVGPEVNILHYPQ